MITYFIRIFILLPLALAGGSFSFSQQVVSHDMTMFNSSNSPLSNNNIRDLLVDHENRLWVATDLGLCSFLNNQWQIYNTANSGLTDNYVRTLAVDANNDIWLGTVNDGVFKFDGTNWLNYNSSNSGLPNDFVRAIAIDQNAAVWIGTVEGLVKFDGTNWTVWTIANSGIFSENISTIEVGQANEKYCGTINGGAIYVSPTDQITNHTISSSEIPDNSMVEIEIDANGLPWFASPAAGLFTDVGAQNWLSINMNNSALPTNSLTAFHIDQFQSFLFGTDQYGLVIRSDNGAFRSYTTSNSALPENHIISLERDTNSVIWIGTNGQGLVKLEEQYAGITEMNETNFSMYPNPAKSSSTIYFSETISNAQLTIYSVRGEIVHMFDLQGDMTGVALPKLSAGTYFLRITADRFVFSETFVVFE